MFAILTYEPYFMNHILMLFCRLLFLTFLNSLETLAFGKCMALVQRGLLKIMKIWSPKGLYNCFGSCYPISSDLTLELLRKLN